MFNVNIKTPELRQWCRSGVFIVNFEHISHFVLVFLLFTLSRQMPDGLEVVLILTTKALAGDHIKLDVLRTLLDTQNLVF